MSISVFAIVLVAALLHALWNALVKGADDKPVILGLIALGHAVPGMAMVLLSASPGWAILPYIIASTVIHWGYYYLLNTAYRLGDLSVVYPIARGFAPVLIALGAQAWIGETLPALAWAGIACVSLGILALGVRVGTGTLARPGLIAAFGCAVSIAAYSLADGVGVRVSHSVSGYIGWLFVLELIVAGFIFSTRIERLRALPWRMVLAGFLGGVISGTAYGLVLYAKTLAPLGIVSALRETSVILAALIGVWWFGEGPRATRMLAAGGVAAGILLITLGAQ